MSLFASLTGGRCAADPGGSATDTTTAAVGGQSHECFDTRGGENIGGSTEGTIKRFLLQVIVNIEIQAGLEAARLEIETLNAQKEKAERMLGNISRSLAGVDDPDDTGPRSNVKQEAPDQLAAGERLHNAGPARKRVKCESDIIELSD